MNTSHDTLTRLMQTLATRAAERPAGSYTTKLLEGGVPKIGEKITEEAAEVIEAAEEPGDDGRQHLIHEVADLVYHTMVLMALKGLGWDDVANELARREGVSGLVEKQSRGQSN